MRKLRILLVIIMLDLATASVYANWGSTAGGSVATGSFYSFGTAQVEMQREDLHIRLYRDRAKVEIDYLFHNTGPSIDVRAGFPSLGVQLEDVKHQEIENYSISADDKPVTFTVESGDPVPFKNLYNVKFREMGELDEYPPDKRPELLEWLVSVVHFDAGQTRRIHIRYDSLYAYCSGGYSDDGDTCDDRFAYVLSTASVWKGLIASGKITIDAVTIPAEQIILSPAGRFHRNGSSFVWQFRNLKPTDADDILVNLNNHSSTIAEYVERTDSSPYKINYFTLENGKYFYLNRNFIPKGESASPDYSASHLGDGDSETEWRTVHAPGIGDALTLDITSQAHIDQVGIIPGCGTNEQARFSHARIREVELTVNGRSTRKAILPDEFTYPWSDSDQAYEWIDLPSYSGNANTIRLIVRSVYPGSTDQVTCIGKVMLRQWLKSKPSIKSGVDGHELP